MSIEERLRRMEDRVAIEQRKFEYCRHADALDPAQMVSIFTEDCTASYGPRIPTISGRAALQDFYASALSTVRSSSHHVSNIEITFGGHDIADLRCYLYSWQRFIDHPEQKDRHRWARYIEKWIRTPSGWRQRDLTYLIAGEVATGDDLRVREHLDHHR
jgi:hypothetical protein